MPHSNTPVLVGAGQYLDRPATLAEAMSPVAMMEATARAAARDAGLPGSALRQVETLIVVDTVGERVVDNPPAALARRIGADGSRQWVTVTGGNTPQMLVNRCAEAISKGETSMVLLSGAEALDTQAKARKAGFTLDWYEGSFGEPDLFSTEQPGSSDTERAHGMVAPIVTYPLFENALRHHRGTALKDHQQLLGNLFAPLTETAAANDFAWFPTRRSAAELIEVTPINRYIGFPYPKYLNAVMQVNQSASLLLMSEAKARELGLVEAQWVYLHGCADVNDIWNVSERNNFYSSDALRVGLAGVFDMADASIDDIDFFDVYSCFPAIVEFTQDALGITPDDPRPLSVTGGLPYFGGAGNNYSMHAIATMMERLRANPSTMGLVTANGWYATKHSLGLYSLRRPLRHFERPDPGILQQQIDAADHPRLNTDPSGPGTIETYTVLYGRNGEPERGLVIGRLADRRRFIAFTSSEPTVLQRMISDDPIGASGVVTRGDATNHFEFAAP